MSKITFELISSEVKFLNPLKDFAEKVCLLYTRLKMTFASSLNLT